MAQQKDVLVVERPEQLWRPGTRREFLRLLGVGGSIVLLPTVFAACDDDDDCDENPMSPECPPGGGGVTLNLGNDTGILNYAYALEQLEAAFYVAVVGSPAFNGMSAEQREVLTDLRDHEVIHREFFKAVLGGNRIPDLALNQNTVNTAIGSAASILKTAEQFEDLGVAAYNGAGKYLTVADNLVVAGKIVSVEARHAAAIRDLREGMGLSGTPANTRFAGDDVVNANGLGVKLEPSAVLARVVATNFVTTSITPTNHPTNTSADFGPPNPTP